MDTKTASLTFLCSVAVVNGIATQYPEPFNSPEPLSIVLTILSAAAIFIWYRADAITRSYKRSPLLNVAVFGLSAVALPYYLVRSRGWKQGALASLGAIVAFVVFCLLSALSAMATAWASMVVGA